MLEPRERAAEFGLGSGSTVVDLAADYSCVIAGPDQIELDGTPLSIA